MKTIYRILAISGSLRARSTNTETLRAAALLAPDALSVSLYAGLGTLPPFNPDLDGPDDIPAPPVRELRSSVAVADALLICSPEYAHGVPGTLKNALDWLVSGPEIVQKPIGLLNVSPRSIHAYTALAETLRTMSTVLVPEACQTIALGGRMLSANAIAGTPEIADVLGRVMQALAAAAAEYRPRRAELLGIADVTSTPTTGTR
jgi:NAD(P)H-dependent FMN reductase